MKRVVLVGEVVSLLKHLKSYKSLPKSAVRDLDFAIAYYEKEGLL